MQIFDILKEISSDNGKIYKENVLRKYKNNETLKKVLQLTYSPLIQFYIRQIPEFNLNPNKQNLNLDEALNQLSLFSNRVLTGNKAKEKLKEILEQLDYKDSEVIKKVISKDLKIGINTVIINKVFGKGFIKETPYMGAVSYNKKKVKKLFQNYSVVSDIKMDGRYTNIKISKDNVLLESRNGKETFFKDTFDFLIDLLKITHKTFFLNELFDSVVLNGELVIDGYDRYTSNGIISSLVSIGNKILEDKNYTKDLIKFHKSYNLTYNEMLKKVVVVVWDFIPYSYYLENKEYKVPYKSRREALQNWIKELNHNQIRFVESEEVSNIKEAFNHYYKALSNNEEGTILKGLEAFWKDGKPNYQIKFKPEEYYDLKIVGFNYGTPGTKNENFISSLNVESEDGLLKTSPGGLTEKDMKYITENKDNLLNKIVEVKCSGISQDKQGNYALLHPVFKRIRDDKNEANTLKDCLNISKANKHLN